jgi:hypothetical protein
MSGIRASRALAKAADRERVSKASVTVTVTVTGRSSTGVFRRSCIASYSDQAHLRSRDATAVVGEFRWLADFLTTTGVPRATLAHTLM